MPLVFDAFQPREIAERVATAGVNKARMPLLPMLMLAMLAGAFIGIGALYYLIVASDPGLGFATGRVLGGLLFSVGLILVILAGAELFTGNNLLVMAWLDRHISTAELLRNWAVVLIGNLIGAVALAVLVWLSQHPLMNGGLIAQKAISIAEQKTSLPFAVALVRGVLCNALVCLAVWLAMAGHSVVDKLFAVMLPVSAFVAAGFEHSVANMYLIPLAILLDNGAHASLNWLTFLTSQIPVILGNLIGGAGLVGTVYHVIYRRKA